MWATGSYKTGGLSTEDGFAGTYDEEEEELNAGDDTEIDSSPKENTDTDSIAPTDQSVTTVEATNEPEAEKQTVPDDVVASTLQLPGQKADIPPDIASTVTLPGSKAGSEIPSPESVSTSGHRSGAATPTKVDHEPVQLAAAAEALKLEEESEKASPQEVEVDDGRRASAILSPLSPASTTQTEYLSAPSTPAPM